MVRVAVFDVPATDATIVDIVDDVTTGVGMLTETELFPSGTKTVVGP